MTLPEIKVQANFTEKPLAGHIRQSDGATILDVNIPGGIGSALISEQYDYIALTYNASNLLTGVVYRTGGASGTIVATLSLGYDVSDNLISVARA